MKQITTESGDFNVSAKSLENIGKLMGMYTEKIESTNTNITQDITMLSEPERKKRIAELMEKAGDVDESE